MENTKKQIGVASISETNNVPAPISEAKKKAGTEPSEKSAEAVAKLLAWQDVRDRSDYQGKTKEQVWAKALDEEIEDEYLRNAREILSLFPVKEAGK